MWFGGIFWWTMAPPHDVMSGLVLSYFAVRALVEGWLVCIHVDSWQAQTMPMTLIGIIALVVTGVGLLSLYFLPMMPGRPAEITGHASLHASGRRAFFGRSVRHREHCNKSALQLECCSTPPSTQLHSPERHVSEKLQSVACQLAAVKTGTAGAGEAPGSSNQPGPVTRREFGCPGRVFRSTRVRSAHVPSSMRKPRVCR